MKISTLNIICGVIRDIICVSAIFILGYEFSKLKKKIEHLYDEHENTRYALKEVTHCMRSAQEILDDGE